MFIVHNLTNMIVKLPDLRVEVRPRRIMDLEEFVSRDSIDKSLDLKTAFRAKKLALARHSIVQNNNIRTTEKVEKPDLDEQKIAKLVKNAVAEELRNQKEPNIAETVHNAVVSSVGGLMSSIREQINSVNIPKESKITQPVIDPEKLAEISQQTIQRISEEIETGGASKSKKINIINKRDASDLASEL